MWHNHSIKSSSELGHNVESGSVDLTDMGWWLNELRQTPPQFSEEEISYFFYKNIEHRIREFKNTLTEEQALEHIISELKGQVEITFEFKKHLISLISKIYSVDAKSFKQTKSDVESSDLNLQIQKYIESLVEKKEIQINRKLTQPEVEEIKDKLRGYIVALLLVSSINNYLNS